MKRFTDKTGTLNGDKHREAFQHAFRVLESHLGKRVYQKRQTHGRTGLRIRFCAELECEDGKTLTFEFSRTKGLLIFIVGTSEGDWILTRPQNPQSLRAIEDRLSAYRQKLHAWHAGEQKPLTFRCFNLLLAAISYDVVQLHEGNQA